jgi:NAD+ kinase
MPRRYRRIGVTVKSAFDRKDETVARIFRILRKERCEIFIDDRRLRGLPCCRGCKSLNEKEKLDLFLVIGGDGTVLRSIREMKNFSVPILSINRGTVGFLAEVELREAEHVLPELLAGGGVLEERSLLSVETRRGKKTLFSG